MIVVAVLLLAALTEIGVVAPLGQSKGSSSASHHFGELGAEIEAPWVPGESLWLRLKPCQ
jgi:hypothetical protein